MTRRKTSHRICNGSRNNTPRTILLRTLDFVIGNEPRIEKTNQKDRKTKKWYQAFQKSFLCSKNVCTAIFLIPTWKCVFYGMFLFQNTYLLSMYVRRIYYVVSFYIYIHTYITNVKIIHSTKLDHICNRNGN